MAKKVKIGDIIEISTKKGLAYAQFSHYHNVPPTFGALLRILPGIFSKRPENLATLIDQKESFSTFFPLQAAINREIVRVIANLPVPSHAKTFPLFRAGDINPATGKITQWWLWNGENSWKVEKLTDDQLDLPMEEICNDVALIDRIEQGWTPRKAEAFIQAARLKNKIKKADVIKGIRHFLLYSNTELALNGQKILNKEGFNSEQMGTGSEDSVMLIVQQPPPLTAEYVEQTAIQLVDIATKSGGIYDAWETML